MSARGLFLSWNVYATFITWGLIKHEQFYILKHIPIQACVFSKCLKPEIACPGADQVLIYIYMYIPRMSMSCGGREIYYTRNVIGNG